MKRIVSLHAVLLCLLSIPAAATLNLEAMPAHDLPLFQELTDQNFIVVYGNGLVGTTKAKVTSTVYTTTGGHLYAYQISNAEVKFSWFSVALNSINVTDWGVEIPGSTPIAWDPVDDPLAAINMEATFSPGLTATKKSAILWFTCTEAPANGVGALAKLSLGGGVYAEGNVLVPLPEPMTIILLSAGWLTLRSWRRKS